MLKSLKILKWQSPLVREIKQRHLKPSRLGKPPPEDKTLGIEPAIRFCSLEDGNDTSEGEEAETLVFHD